MNYVHVYLRAILNKRKLVTPTNAVKMLVHTVHTTELWAPLFLSCLILFLTVMELLSCLTLCSSCSRSSFSSELHFISFCFSSSLAEAENNTIKQLISLMNCLHLSQLMFKRRKQSSVTFFVSDVGMNNSQSTRPRNGFFFFQDLEKQAQSCHRCWDSEKIQTRQI